VITAIVFVVAGIQMLGIRSVAGDTINEAFYNAVGVLSFGLAGLALLITAGGDEARNDPKKFRRCAARHEVVWKSASRCPHCTAVIDAA
jgi:hypothetical protein